jgi:hypothetical protein
MDSIARFLQGVFTFTGGGLSKPLPLADTLVYRVPSDRRAQLIYLRAGSSADDLVTLVLTRDGRPMRYFPLGAKGAMHVPLAVVEDLLPDTKIEILVAAPQGVSGMIVLDVGFIEIV